MASDHAATSQSLREAEGDEERGRERGQWEREREGGEGAVGRREFIQRLTNS